MKFFAIAAGLLLSGQSFATDVYVECKLEVKHVVDGIETVVASDYADYRIHLPQTEPATLELAVPGYSASYYWNVGFIPVLKIEDEVNEIRTANNGWEVFIDRGNERTGRTVASLACAADA